MYKIYKINLLITAKLLIVIFHLPLFSVFLAYGPSTGSNDEHFSCGSQLKKIMQIANLLLTNRILE